MAFQSKNLSVISYANGFTLWHYASLDTGATMLEENYFGGASDALRSGDMILVNSDIANAIGCQMLAVSESLKSTVEVKPFASAA
ncbi:MAG: hypothetical protein AB8B77_03575 [Alphaproteobacteria bacterium]